MTAKKPGGNRRRKGEGSIVYLSSRKCWRWELKSGSQKFTLYARTLEDADGRKGLYTKVREFQAKQSAGIVTPANYTVERCISAWIAEQAAVGDVSDDTVRDYAKMAKHITRQIGSRLVTELVPADCQKVLNNLRTKLATRSIGIVRSIMIRAFKYAQFNKLVGDNPAELTRTPRGLPGRPSQAFSLAETMQLFEYARQDEAWPYVALSTLGGLRPEEVRGLLWSEVDLTEGTVAVYRSDRVGGDTKTDSSRRLLEMPRIVIEALQQQVLRQAAQRAKVGSLWYETNHVITGPLGRGLDGQQARNLVKRVLREAGLGTDGGPRWLRHTFASVLSDAGISIEEIADAMGHSSPNTTRTVYRHNIKPVTRTAATVMDKIFAEGQVAAPAVSDNDRLRAALESLPREVVIKAFGEYLSADTTAS